MSANQTDKPELRVILACPRGFCAGVTRAILVVEKALEKFGAPVYVRHEIVHNRFVVTSLEEKGAIFVDELNEVPDGQVVIFSAHGVPKSVKAEAEKRGLHALDATCPLVGKVHREAERQHEKGFHTILIGHSSHPEVIGTCGQVPDGQITVIDSAGEIAKLNVPDSEKVGYVTQTTLSFDQTGDIIKTLKKRFPNLRGPSRNDICYATTNRQKAVKLLAKTCDVIMVIGAPNSSNSRRLVEVAKQHGCKKAFLVQRAAGIDWDSLPTMTTLGITAGASAPEILVKEVIEAVKNQYTIKLDEEVVTKETICFDLPAELKS